MRTRIPIVLALALALVTLPARAADDPPLKREPTPEQEKLVDEVLARDRERNFAVPAHRRGEDLWEPMSPYKALFGDLAKGSPGDVEATARGFLKSYGKVLGFTSADPLAELSKVRDMTMDGARALTYGPVKDGCQYLNGQVLFGFDRAGNLVAVVGHKKLADPVASTLSPGDAIARAKEMIRAQAPDEAAEDVSAITGTGEVAEYISESWVPDGNLYKMFMVDLTVGKPPHPVRVPVIGKGKGEALYAEDGRLMGAEGEVYDVDPLKTPKLSERDFRDVEHPGSFWKTWTLNGKYVKAHPSFTQRAADFWGNFEENPDKPDPNPAFCEVNAYYHLTEARAKALAWGATEIEKARPLIFHPFYEPPCKRFLDDSWWPQPRPGKEKAYQECVEAGQNAAYFSYADEGLYFGSDNPGLNKRMPAYDATALAHEYGHWLEKQLNRFWMMGGPRLDYAEAKAVSEGFGDFFAASVVDDPVIAKYTLGNMKGTPDDQSRDLRSSLKYSEVEPVCTDGDDCKRLKVGDEHEIHSAGVVFGAACWKLRAPLGKDGAARTVIAGIRIAPTPVTFLHASLGVIAADQMLSAKPDPRVLRAFLDHETLPEPRRAK